MTVVAEVVATSALKKGMLSWSISVLMGCLTHLGPAGASWCQLVQHPKVSKLPYPQAMFKSSTISSQSDDQQAGKFHKLGKSIW